MLSIRDHKRAARRALHGHMSIPALYIPNPEIPALFIQCRVRVHTKSVPIGGLGMQDTAERIEPTPKIVFWRSEVAMPERNAIVSVEPGEAYYVESCEPPDGETITAFVARVDLEDTTALPVPEVQP